jgi:hypothetical protein
VESRPKQPSASTATSRPQRLDASTRSPRVGLQMPTGTDDELVCDRPSAANLLSTPRKTRQQTSRVAPPEQATAELPIESRQRLACLTGK